MTAELAAWSGTADIERAADPGEFVVQACERAKQWLIEALEKGDIDQIVELKSQAEAIRVYTMQKQLGKDAELSAAEIVRRAERGIGAAVRRGQEMGEIAKKGDPPSAPAAPYERVREGRKEVVAPGSRQRVRDPNVRSPREFFGSSSDLAQTYAVTDGVTDEQFETALAEAKSERNLSRANVLRKVQGVKQRTSSKIGQPQEWVPDPSDRSTEAAVQRRKLIRAYASDGLSSRQISERIGTLDGTIREIAREMGVEITADAVVLGTRRHDSNRIVRETVHALEGLAMGIDLINFGDLNPDEAEDWTISLTNSIRTLNRLNKKIKEMVQ